MYILFNKDGSIFDTNISEYVMQGSNLVNVIYVAFVDSEYLDWSASGNFTLPDDSNSVLVGVSTTFLYKGVNYTGWKITLTNNETKYDGTLNVSINLIKNEQTLYTYLFNITINRTGYPLDGEWNTNINYAQFNTLMAQIATKFGIGTTALTVEELPLQGSENIIYYLDRNGYYEQYMFNGSEYVLLGTTIFKSDIPTINVSNSGTLSEGDYQTLEENYTINIIRANNECILHQAKSALDTTSLYFVGITTNNNIVPTFICLKVLENRNYTLIVKQLVDIDEINNELATINGSITTIESDIDSLQTKTNGLAGEVNAISSEIDNIDTSITSIENDVENLETKTTNLESSVSSINSEIDTINSDLDKKLDKLQLAQGNLLYARVNGVDFGAVYDTQAQGNTIVARDSQGHVIGAEPTEATHLTTKSYVDSAVGSVSTIKFSIVEQLPSTGESNIIYLVPNTTSGEKNVYDEYIWVNNAFEIIGSTAIDLSNYGKLDSNNVWTGVQYFNDTNGILIDGFKLNNAFLTNWQTQINKIGGIESDITQIQTDLNNKVSKTSNDGAYVNSGNTITNIPVSNTPTANAIPRYDSNGFLKSASTTNYSTLDPSDVITKETYENIFNSVLNAVGIPNIDLSNLGGAFTLDMFFGTTAGEEKTVVLETPTVSEAIITQIQQIFASQKIFSIQGAYSQTPVDNGKSRVVIINSNLQELSVSGIHGLYPPYYCTGVLPNKNYQYGLQFSVYVYFDAFTTGSPITFKTKVFEPNSGGGSGEFTPETITINMTSETAGTISFNDFMKIKLGVPICIDYYESGSSTADNISTIPFSVYTSGLTSLFQLLNYETGDQIVIAGTTGSGSDGAVQIIRLYPSVLKQNLFNEVQTFYKGLTAGNSNQLTINDQGALSITDSNGTVGLNGQGIMYRLGGSTNILKTPTDSVSNNSEIASKAYIDSLNYATTSYVENQGYLKKENTTGALLTISNDNYIQLRSNVANGGYFVVGNKTNSLPGFEVRDNSGDLVFDAKSKNGKVDIGTSTARMFFGDGATPEDKVVKFYSGSNILTFGLGSERLTTDYNGRVLFQVQTTTVSKDFNQVQQGEFAGILSTGITDGNIIITSIYDTTNQVSFLQPFFDGTEWRAHAICTAQGISATSSVEIKYIKLP